MTGQLIIEAKVVLLDIEGTISPTSFVKEQLFGYARARLADYVAENRDQPAVRQILAETVKRSGTADAVATLIEWQDNDEKVPPLKELQGLIWERGYDEGALVSRLFADAQAAIEVWRAEKLPIYIYSSGSVKAQDLFFRHNEIGDIRKWFAGYFDTRIGAKAVARSYEKIAEQLAVEPRDMVFLSDNSAELAAALRAGLQVVLVTKETSSLNGRYPAIDDFAVLDIRKVA